LHLRLAAAALLLSAPLAWADGPISPPPPQTTPDCAGGNSVIGYLTVGGVLHCGTALATGSIGTSSIGQLGHFTGTSTVSGFNPTGDITFTDPALTINSGAVTSSKLASSLALPGAPTTTTPATADSSTKIATTAYVQAQGYLIGNQSITVSGDVSGSGTTSIAGTVTGLQGRAVAATAPTANQVLTWNGSQWAPAAASAGGLNQLTSDVAAGPGTGSQAATVVGLQGRAVAATAPSTNQLLGWNGTQWVPVNAPTSGINQLTGDAVAGPGIGAQAVTLANTGVTSGNYTVSDGTSQFCWAVDAKGRVTGITAGACGGGGTHFVLLNAGGHITLNGGGSLLTNGS
jgi:hypothetical protein